MGCSGCNTLAGDITVCANGVLPDITKDKPAATMMQALQQSQGGTVSLTVPGGSFSPYARVCAQIHVWCLTGILLSEANTEQLKRR